MFLRLYFHVATSYYQCLVLGCQYRQRNFVQCHHLKVEYITIVIGRIINFTYMKVYTLLPNLSNTQVVTITALYMHDSLCDWFSIKCSRTLPPRDGESLVFLRECCSSSSSSSSSSDSELTSPEFLWGWCALIWGYPVQIKWGGAWKEGELQTMMQVQDSGITCNETLAMWLSDSLSFSSASPTSSPFFQYNIKSFTSFIRRSNWFLDA